MFCSLINKSQNENRLSKHTMQMEKSDSLLPTKKLTPVYFNCSKRQLKDFKKNRIDPKEFLNLCRYINDTAVQLQVARYDAFTKDKERLGLIALCGGFSAICFIGSAGASSESGNNVTTSSFAFFGIVGLLIIPVTAICSSVPHQRRKTVLFRDLPIAYNQFVENNL